MNLVLLPLDSTYYALQLQPLILSLLEETTKGPDLLVLSSYYLVGAN